MSVFPTQVSVVSYPPGGSVGRGGGDLPAEDEGPQMCSWWARMCSYCDWPGSALTAGGQQIA